MVLRHAVKAMSKPTLQSIRPHLRGFLAWLSLLLVPTVMADELLAELDDAVARVHYAWYAGDARALAHARDVVMRTEVTASHAALKSYQTAVAFWRLADIRHAQAPHDAKKAADQCVRHGRKAAAQAQALVEARVVQALCEELSASARTTARRPSCDEGALLQQVHAQSPGNPRVSWALAWCAHRAGHSAKALEHAMRAITHFEAESLAAGSPHSDWGHAEACVLLGQLMLAAGNRGAARDYVEQALVLTPDYVAAKQLLELIATS
jgi:tetratricopeptide (TPR) repeat protein